MANCYTTFDFGFYFDKKTKTSLVQTGTYAGIFIFGIN
jgi:hypothetical protein